MPHTDFEGRRLVFKDLRLVPNRHELAALESLTNVRLVIFLAPLMRYGSQGLLILSL